MSGRHSRSRAPRRPAPPVDRATAAGLLRAARTARRMPEASGPDDPVEWACSVLPDSPAARRLRIEQLLEQGDFESADALIARGLRQRPMDTALSLLHARSLARRGRFDAAARELRVVLLRRPHHRGALMLAATVALRRDRPLGAVSHLVRAEARRAGDDVRHLLSTAWLAAGRPAAARRVVARMRAPSARLRARLLRAEGRPRDAADVLDAARRTSRTGAGETETLALIDLLEEEGDLPRLRRLLAALPHDRPALLARAGRAWLAVGAFRTAATRMARLARIPGHRAEALAVLTVAAAMLDRPRLARRALRRLQRIDEPVEPRTVADLWCRGLLGRLLRDQCSAPRCGCDPHTGPLKRLLGEAARTFHRHLAAPDARDGAASRRRIRHQAAVGRALSADLGRSGPSDPAAGAPLAA